MKKLTNNSLGIFAAVITFVIILVSIMVILFASSVFSLNKAFVAQTSQSVLIVKLLLSLSALGFSAYLIFIYLQDYLELRSGFTLALLLSLISFMLFALTANPLLHTACGAITQADLFSLIPLVFANISMAILAWVSSK